jgi:hypothetical protein
VRCIIKNELHQQANSQKADTNPIQASQEGSQHQSAAIKSVHRQCQKNSYGGQITLASKLPASNLQELQCVACARRKLPSSNKAEKGASHSDNMS